IVEAKEKTGGRMNTINHPRSEKPVELGAEFVHGNLPLTLQLFEKAGIKKIKTGGQIWQQKNGQLQQQNDFIEDYKDLKKKFKLVDADISVEGFMLHYLTDDKYRDLRFSLKNYVQGYYAGDIKKASTYALFKELATGEEVNYRVAGSYQLLANYLESECRNKGVMFYLGEDVNEISWTSSGVEVLTANQKVSGKKIIVTVSIGVLQSENIRFSPALPQKMEAVKQLGFGHVVKIIFQFSEAFWKHAKNTWEKDLSKLSFLFSEQTIPTWWTQHPENEAILVGWLGGPPTEGYKASGKEELVQKSLASLAAIFTISPGDLQKKFKGAQWYNWSHDVHFCGAYSYNVVGGETLIKEMLEPVENTIYFAGEGLQYSNETGTVEAALISGRDVAQQLIANF
ncbi:MAG: FAD-dependent oxidoreductase, partial [Bacteroidota bacterium]|nr:FAD-dependent oxidoreductase [Bacteroidota bacterium]